MLAHYLNELDSHIAACGKTLQGAELGATLEAYRMGGTGLEICPECRKQELPADNTDLSRPAGPMSEGTGEASAEPGGTTSGQPSTGASRSQKRDPLLNPIVVLVERSVIDTLDMLAASGREACSDSEWAVIEESAAERGWPVEALTRGAIIANLLEAVAVDE